MKDKKGPILQEVTESIAEPKLSPNCGFCSLLCQSNPGKGAPDSPSLHFMTEREIQVLAAMRRLKEEASKIKSHMRRMDEAGMSEDRMALSGRLADLKEEWKKMNKERMDAAEERMRLLGHIQ